MNVAGRDWWQLEDDHPARRLGVLSCWAPAIILLSVGLVEYWTSGYDFPLLPTEELPNGNAVVMLIAPVLLFIGGTFAYRASDVGFSIIMNTLITVAGIVNVGACLLSRDSGVVGTALNLLVAVTTAYLWPIRIAILMAILSTVGINVIYFAVDPLEVAVAKGILTTPMVLSMALALASSREQQRRDAALLREAAYRDALTGLASRQRIDVAIENRNPKNFPKEGIGLAVFDVDRFKSVNDTHGHATGDALLRALAARLEQHTPEGSTAFRLGGDEFGIAFIGQSARDTERICLELLADIEQTWIWAHGDKVHLRVSYGVDHSTTFEGFADLYPNADKKLYEAKRAVHAEDSVPERDVHDKATPTAKGSPSEPSNTA